MLLCASALAWLVLKRFGGDDWTVEALTAMTEAAMVGGLADWFAVTALFRHPLGIPIPHTAIIPNRKDAIGQSLGSFVEQNFMSREVITDRLVEAETVHRLGRWLSNRDNARRVTDQLIAAASGIGEVVDDERVSSAIADRLESRLAEVDAAAMLGRLIDATMDGGHHVLLVDATLSGADRFMSDNARVLRSQLHESSPWWVPAPVDDRVYRKISDEFTAFVAEVRSDPDHPIRRHLDESARQFAAELRTSAELRARGEVFKREILDHREVRAWTGNLWIEAKAALRDIGAEPNDTADHLVDSIQGMGRRLIDDPEFTAMVEGWIESAVIDVVDRHGHEFTALIVSTVERWDATDTADRIEQQVGGDLQFIRINGTIVGGLAGLCIYAIGQLL